ncbi:hypothetical protein QYE77_14670 (plasmid) [Thermanaerothrix sp. 4228-RoL]|uniref:Uncharacterized protein n=1 Tax=Thermanaerothrix solaris TaxID=3058434 RepID=A0ABU3NRP6_9CHLR|nr:hypothetical protein [Thermanaerothrix sp. 4228-RoL]MCX7590483.1 hypothetical protein [Kiritimatiellia bacterium]MDT8899505.1 hypothetical protein [Thermanaerothrix sp. 4228-RoL]
MFDRFFSLILLFAFILFYVDRIKALILSIAVPLIHYMNIMVGLLK